MPYLLRVRRFYATLSGRNRPRFLTNDSCLRTITAIATLSRWAGDGSQWAPTLDPIGIAQPLDHTGRKRTALPTAVACVVETCGNLDVNVRAGELPDPLDHFRRRT